MVNIEKKYKSASAKYLYVYKNATNKFYMKAFDYM